MHYEDAEAESPGCNVISSSITLAERSRAKPSFGEAWRVAIFMKRVKVYQITERQPEHER
jgi:hypothetical protein